MNPAGSLLPPPNLPILLPDQLLYDWCGRVHLWNGNSKVTDTSLQLFSAPYAALLHDFPAHLGELTTRTAKRLGSSEELALRHTQLGYFLPFVPLSLARELLAGVINGALPHLKYKLGLPASRLGGNHPLKGCEECFSQDEISGSPAYWRVPHQYPTTLVCVRHRRALISDADTKTPVHRREWLLPTSSPDRIWATFVVPEGRMDLLVKLASFSEELGKLSPGTLEGVTLARTYQSMFSETGFVTAGGSLRTEALIRYVRTYYDGLEALPGLHVLRSVRGGWPGLVGTLVRSSPRPGHPLKHLLLICLLFDSWRDFQARYERVSTETPAWLEENVPASPSSPDHRIAEFAALVKDQGHSLRGAAASVGVCAGTGVRWAKVEKLPFTPRTKALNSAFLERVRKLLRQGLSKTQVIAKSGISAASLNRMISSEPELGEAWRTACWQVAQTENRQRFLFLITRHPGVPVNALRKLPGNGYHWLYRHDRVWLAEHMPRLWPAQG